MRINQAWGVFAGPSKSDGWFVLEASLMDSSQVNLLDPQSENMWQKPELISATYDDHRVRKYARRLRKGNRSLAKCYADYAIEQWNQHVEEPKNVFHATLWYMKEDALLNNEYTPVEKVKLYSYGKE